MSNRLIVLCMLMCILTSCANIPSNVVSPRISFYTDRSDTVRPYRAVLSAGIFNENSSKALISCTGQVLVYDNAHKKVLYKSAFSIPEILPFSTGVFTVEERITKQELDALIKMLAVPPSELSGIDALEGIDVPPAFVELKSMNCAVKKIDVLLKGKN